MRAEALAHDLLDFFDLVGFELREVAFPLGLRKASLLVGDHPNKEVQVLAGKIQEAADLLPRLVGREQVLDLLRNPIRLAYAEFGTRSSQASISRGLVASKSASRISRFTPSYFRANSSSPGRVGCGR
jgi:hypothetical protein